MCIKILNQVMVLIMSLVLLTSCAALTGRSEEVRVDSPAERIISETTYPDGFRVESLEYKVQDKNMEAETITPVAKEPGLSPPSDIAPEEVPEEVPQEVPEEVPQEVPKEVPKDKEEFSLNFDDADLFEVIDVLAKALQINYLVDPRVKGTVTIHTTGKIGKEGLFSVMEHILRINGVAMVKIGDLYKILPFSEAQTEPISPRIERGLAETSRPTGGEAVIQIVPLKFVSSAEMVKILKPFLTPGGNIYEVPKTNLLVITDIASNIQKLLQMTRIFDIQIFENIKVEIFPIENTNAEDITTELESIFTAYGLLMKDDKVGVKFIPVPRLNSILTIASNFELLSQAWDWVKKLDQRVELGTNVNVYFVENVKADDLAQVLNQIYGEEGISPKPAGKAPTGKAAEGVVLKGKVKVIPDTATNALVILATPEDYKTIVQTIKKLDIVPRQVLIEVVIAEVSLTDDLQYGLAWFLEHGGVPIGPFGGRGTGRIDFDASPAASVLTYRWLDSADEVRLLVGTLAKESKINILSTPNVLVSDNQEATINVGREVPVVTGQLTTIEAVAGGAQTTFQYQQTGVIIKVTPHINSVGLVTLDITQEFSQPSVVQIGGTTTQEFLTRKTSTSLVVNKDKTVVMAGLIQEVIETARSGIPFLKDIPLLGFLFGSSIRLVDRTELMVLITPHVIMTSKEADEVTTEFRDKMKEIKKLLKSWPQAEMVEPKPEEPAEPTVNRKPEPGLDKRKDTLLKGRPISSHVIKTQPVSY